MLKNKKVVIFDWDGTLADTIGIWNAVDEELIKTIGDGTIDNVDIGNQRDTKLKEYSKCEDAYLEYCGFLGEKYKSTMNKKDIKTLRYNIAQKYLKEVVDYKPYAEQVIKYLKSKGYTLVIASTTNDFTMDTYKKQNKNIITKANLEDYFSLIYSKGAAKELKPNPEIHYRVLKELNVEPEDCLIVEDSLIGVEAAKNAGIEVAVMYDKYSDCNREEINEMAQYKFADFKEMLEAIKMEWERNIMQKGMQKGTLAKNSNKREVSPKSWSKKWKGAVQWTYYLSYQMKAMR